MYSELVHIHTFYGILGIPRSSLELVFTLALQ